jgi:hypothetical protein
MVIENQYFHNAVRGATEVRGSLSGMIFDKSLRLPGGGGAVSSLSKDGGAKSSLGAGGVLNLLQSDASLLEFTAMQLHTIWDGPLQVSSSHSTLHVNAFIPVIFLTNIVTVDRNVYNSTL